MCAVIVANQGKLEIKSIDPSAIKIRKDRLYLCNLWCIYVIRVGKRNQLIPVMLQGSFTPTQLLLHKH